MSIGVFFGALVLGHVVIGGILGAMFLASRMEAHESARADGAAHTNVAELESRKGPTNVAGESDRSDERDAA